MQPRQLPQHQSEEIRDTRWSFNLLLFCAGCAAMIVQPFTRRNCGAEAFGPKALVACLAILIYGENQQSPEVITFWWFWFGALILQRIQTLLLYHRGVTPHSRDEGCPWLGYMVPGVKSYRQARLMEVIVIFASGIFFCTVSVPLGKLIQFAAGSLLFIEFIDRFLIYKERQRQNDALIEMRARADLFSDLTERR